MREPSRRVHRNFRLAVFIATLFALPFSALIQVKCVSPPRPFSTYSPFLLVAKIFMALRSYRLPTLFAIEIHAAAFFGFSTLTVAFVVGLFTTAVSGLFFSSRGLRRTFHETLQRPRRRARRKRRALLTSPTLLLCMRIRATRWEILHSNYRQSRAPADRKGDRAKEYDVVTGYRFRSSYPEIFCSTRYKLAIFSVEFSVEFKLIN